MIKLLLKLSVPVAAVLVSSYLLPKVDVESFGHAILVAILLGLLNIFVKPVLQILTIPITLLTLGLFLIVLDALMVLAADKLIEGFSVGNIWWAILFSLIVSVSSSLFYSLLE